MYRRLTIVALAALSCILGCDDTQSPPPETHHDHDSTHVGVNLPEPGSIPGPSEIMRLCESFMVHAKVVEVNEAEGWLDVVLELKDMRKVFPRSQGKLLIQQLSFWLVFHRDFFEYAGECNSRLGMFEDGSGYIGQDGTHWYSGDSGQVEYDERPQPRGRIGLSQYCRRDGGHGCTKYPLPIGGKAIFGKVRLYLNPDAVGTTRLYSYYGLSEMRFKNSGCLEQLSGRSAWGHEITVTPEGHVIVGPETQFCDIYPGCAQELTHCGDCL